MTPTEILAAHGVLRAPEVVELAAAARLDLACAAVLLMKESGGGRNVWGSDPVPTGGSYDKGGPVTRSNYLAYRAAVSHGAAGRQGVGPTQLTYGPFQAQADRAGGCWDWRANVATGFDILADLIGRYGERDGFRRYNGSGAAADRYADDAMDRLRQWRSRLAESVSESATQEEDVALTDDEIERIARRTADLTLQRPTANAFGDVVEVAQILNGIEQRVAHVEHLLATSPDA